MEIFLFESVDEHTDRWMADRALLYYKLNLWAFGSGELKSAKGTVYATVYGPRQAKNTFEHACAKCMDLYHT